MGARIETETGSEAIRAAGWMMGAVAALTSMAVAGREVSFALDTFEIMAYRSIAGVALLAVILRARGAPAWPRLRRPGLHLSRNLAHFTAQNLWFYAIISLPLAQVFALEFTAPLWVLVLSPLILGERLTRPRALAALLGFAGILLVAQPGAAPLSPALLAAAGCALGFAFTYIFTKRLTAQVDTIEILWWMTVSQTVFGLVCALIDGEMALPSAQSLPWIAVIAAAGLSAHYCITNALRRASAMVVMPFDFLRLPLIALIGYLAYDEPVGLAVVVGAALILGGNYISLRADARRSPRA
ncbi:DMT family transporter [Limimaricola cinnabarinus]|nr:DMT family transporter [Limimaricola cinnabarinus]